MAHDDSNEYMSAAVHKQRATRRFNRIHKPWETQIDRERAQGIVDIEHLENATRVAEKRVKAQRDMLDHVGQIEEGLYKVLANMLQSIVDAYRIALGRSLAENGHKIVIDGQDLSGQQYQQFAINLDGPFLRSILS
jgi:hypothetical protein